MPDADSRAHETLKQIAAYIDSLTADMTKDDASAARIYSLSLLLAAQLAIDAPNIQHLSQGIDWITNRITTFASDFYAEFAGRGPQFPAEIFDVDGDEQEAGSD